MDDNKKNIEKEELEQLNIEIEEELLRLSENPDEAEDEEVKKPSILKKIFDYVLITVLILIIMKNVSLMILKIFG